MTEIRPVSTKMTSFEKEGVQGAVEMGNGLYNVAKSAGSTIWDCTKAVAEGAVDIVDGVVDTATGAVKYAGALVKTPFGGILDIDSMTDKDDVKTETVPPSEPPSVADADPSENVSYWNSFWNEVDKEEKTPLVTEEIAQNIKKFMISEICAASRKSAPLTFPEANYDSASQPADADPSDPKSFDPSKMPLLP